MSYRDESQRTQRQARAIELLGLLGSDTKHCVPDGRNVYVPLPFRRDNNPNVKVFSDGSYHDFSASPGWEDLSLRYFGELEDLERAGKSYFANVWSRLPGLTGDAKQYAELRRLDTVLLREEEYRDREGVRWTVICFPMYEGERMVGIQRRFIREHTPKNLMFHGSESAGAFFMNSGEGRDYSTIYVCEGATDTYTNFLRGKDAIAIGAPSCSSIDGVIKFLLSQDESIDVVLCFDADDPGQEAQNKVYLAIKDRFPQVFELVHSEDCKDLNDEWTKHGGLVHRLIRQPDPGEIFVRVVDVIREEDISGFGPREVNFVSFFPPNFPGAYHTPYPDAKARLYVFPLSYGQAEVNRLMWKLKKSAYILRGW